MAPKQAQPVADAKKPEPACQHAKTKYEPTAAGLAELCLKCGDVRINPSPEFSEPTIQFVRAKRKGMGWIAETVQVPVSWLADLDVKEVHEWDRWPAVENRLSALAKASEPKR